MKKIVLVILLTGSHLASYGQRQLPGQKGVEVGIGMVSDEKPMRDFMYARLGMTINKRKGNYQFLALEYRHKKHVFETTDIPVESYTVEGGYSIHMLGDWRKTFSLNLGLSGVAGYEVINKGEKQLSSGALILNEDKFLYGGGLYLSLETYLGDKIVLLLQGQTKYLMGSSVEHWRPGAGVGIRYIF
jgi:hypothetical protein